MCSSVAAATSLLLHNFCALRFVTLLLDASFVRSFVPCFVPSFVRSFVRSFVLSVSQSVSFFVLFLRWLFLPSFFFCFLLIPDATLLSALLCTLHSSRLPPSPFAAHSWRGQSHKRFRKRRLLQRLNAVIKNNYTQHTHKHTCIRTPALALRTLSLSLSLF